MRTVVAARRPRRSRAARGQAGRDLAEGVGVRQMGWERQFDLRFQLLDATRDLYEHEPDRLEGRCPPAGFARGRQPHVVQQPVGAHVQEEAELVGLPAMTGRLVGTRVQLHVFDQILHAAARAVDLLVEVLGPPRQVPVGV